MKPKRILAVASGGGHWVQLLRVRKAFKEHDVAYATVAKAYQADVAGERFYVVKDATRWNKLGLLRLVLRLAWILIRERPDVVVSTGAAPGYVGLRIGKWFGAKTVWVDSIANVDRLSLSGKRIGPYADLWLTQWPHLSRPDGPSCVGAVFRLSSQLVPKSQSPASRARSAAGPDPLLHSSYAVTGSGERLVRADPATAHKRILAVASGGGHWVELLRLRRAFDGHDVAYVTVAKAYRSDLSGGRFYTVKDATRWNRFGLVHLAVQLVWILLRERPDVVVSTGAAPGYVGLRIGKVFGAKTIWVDSIANVDRLSLSGERIGPYADLWLTQWPHLTSPDGPHCAGAVL